MENGWLKFKKYPHIGEPLTKKSDSHWLTTYVTNPEKIISHKFTPFLHKTLSQRKYRPLKGAPKNSSKKRQRTATDPKRREIYFLSHIDSIIYSYYNYLLTIEYENYLKDKPYSQVAVAYRKIPLKKGHSGNKCNIEFAFEAFNFIEKNKDRKLSIIVADVTSFFDNLNHQLLHKQWKAVLSTTNLPKDHYAVYKNLVDFKFVNENELFNRFHHKLIIERNKPNNPKKKELKRKNVKRIYNLKKEQVVAYCSKSEFYKEATDLIRKDKPFNRTLRESLGKGIKRGIPQGTPISATLANIYMLPFDEYVFEKTNSRNAFFQRYSDDLIIICDQADEKHFYELIKDQIESKAQLEIQSKKTNIYRYEKNSDSIFQGGIVEDEKLNPNKQLEYLGFSYDGSKIRVKSSGFSKFYRNMKRSFRRGVHFAKKSHTPSNSLFETRLYKRFTHLGSKRRLKWLPDDDSPTGYSRSTQQDWGNFISYLNKANEVMKEINGDDTIKKQYKKVWNIFHQIKMEAYEKIGSLKS